MSLRPTQLGAWLAAAAIGAGVVGGTFLHKRNQQSNVNVLVAQMRDHVRRNGPASTLVTILSPTVLPSQITAGTLTTGLGGAINCTRASIKYCNTGNGLDTAQLLPAPETLGTWWNTAHLVVAAPTVTNYAGDTNAPDGSITATKIVYPATTAAEQTTLDQQGVTVPSAGTYTLSLYLKGTGAQTFYFDVSSSTAGSGNHFVSAALSASWQRFTLTFTTTAGGLVGVDVGSDTRAAVENEPQMAAQTVYVWGVKVEAGSSATTYVPPPLRQMQSNQICVEPNGILAETSRTNLALRSETLATSPWAGFGSVSAAPTLTNNTTDVIAPNGSQNATKLVFPDTTAANAVSVDFQSITTATATHTFSVWLRTLSGTATVYLSTDAPSTNLTCAVTSTWQRFTFSAALTAGSHNVQLGVNLGRTGNAGQPPQTVYAWGFQLESGTSATSYIPTTSASVTRSGDVISLASALAFPAGTYTVSADIWVGDNASLPVSVVLYNSGSDVAYLEVNAGHTYANSHIGGVTASIVASDTVSNGVKSSSQIKFDGTKVYSGQRGGTLSSTADVATLSPSYTVGIGSAYPASTNSTNGWVSNIVISN